jgi:hypothetical protein
MKPRRMRWVRHAVRMTEWKDAYRNLMGRPTERRPLGRPRRRWHANIKMDLQKERWENMGWIALSQDRDRWLALVNVVINLRVS